MDKPEGRFRCVACGRECNGSELYQDSSLKGGSYWSCSNPCCGAAVVRIGKKEKSE